ncbi:MAG: hypothetical protein KDK37_19300, partial [Leptospiraceae bacterium]|nr:hypothetical protein [Leptospiraceae bacterium]
TIQTATGNRTIAKSSVQRVFYGDAYRKQQDAIKKRREEEQRRKEEEAKRKAEEEARRLEEQKRLAEEEAKRQSEQERREQERREAEEKARLEQERKDATDARNPFAIWIFSGPAGAQLMPGNFRDNFSMLSLFGQEIASFPNKTEGSGGIFGVGFAVPVWDMIFIEAEGMATGQWQDFLALEGGKDTVDSTSNATRVGFGLGEFGRIVRSTGDIRFGYKVNARELANLGGWALESQVYERIELEPVLGYKFRQHDSLFSYTSTGYSSFGPSLYLANTSGSTFSRAKGPTWGFRVRYTPVREFPIKLELGLYAYLLTADIETNVDRNVLFNIGLYQI